MKRVPLGRTGLTVGVAGLGCGGHSRLGLGGGASRASAVAVVRRALELGIDLIDTAAVYGTEEIVGEALEGRRDAVVISTKVQVVRSGTSARGQDFIDAADFVRGVEDCLARLRTDRIDILHLHGVMPEQYAYCREALVPALERLREAGKIRFLGLTERFIHDPQHRMLEAALADDCWDVVMTGFNLVNPSAVERVLAPARSKGIGTLIMFAVRRALSDPAALRELIDGLLSQGLIDPAQIDRADPLGFLAEEGGARSVIDGAYRFCRHAAGADVVLTGTGSVAHLEENVASIDAGPLAQPCLDRLRTIFGGIDSVSGN